MKTITKGVKENKEDPDMRKRVKGGKTERK